jgi:hypothetical protein
MQEEYLRENFKKMLEYYPTLVEHTVYFKVYSKKIIAEYKSKACGINSYRREVFYHA